MNMAFIYIAKDDKVQCVSAVYTINVICESYENYLTSSFGTMLKLPLRATLLHFETM